MGNRLLRALAPALGLAFIPAVLHAAPITHAAPYAGGVSHIPTFGEVFTPPASHTVLDSFSFYFQTSGTGSYPFSAYVYEWNGSAVSGSALYTSAGTAGADGYYTVNPGLALVAGQSYIAMFSWPVGWAEGLGCAALNIDCPVNPSPSTQFHYTNAVTEAGWQNAANWNGLINGTWRIAFDLTLTDTPTNGSVPEPATIVLVGAGTILALRRRGRTGASGRVPAAGS